jgi:AcrR family transcriptional regulator
MSITEASPNQREKQRQIVDAAKVVLLREGLAACTARVLAEESSFSRSAIHYYFESMDEIVDAAMAGHLEDFVADLRATAATVEDPVARFWAVTERYHLALGEQPERTMLWFDYSIAAVRAGRPEPAIAIEVALREVLAGLLKDCGVRDWKVRSEAVLAFMIGTTLRRVLHPGSPVRNVREQLAGISGLERRTP